MAINPSQDVAKRARIVLLNDLREDFTEALAALMVGNQFPWDIIDAHMGEVICPANRKVTKTSLRRVSFMPRRLEYDRSQVPENISATIEQFAAFFDELDALGDTDFVATTDLPDKENSDIPEPQIDGSDRTAVLCVIRKIFSGSSGSYPSYSADDVAFKLYYPKRAGKRIKEVLRQDLLTAVAHSIIKGQSGKLKIVAEEITGYEEDILADVLIYVIGHDWKDPDEAVRNFARWLGFAQTTPAIKETARSLISDLIRKSHLEQSDAGIRRIS